ncbi:MAG: hypothetical protein E7597_04535 [Ruminococcaceae bacterium]|nr:hypothetical protein [Oscillospiraceae bacterium]
MKRILTAFLSLLICVSAVSCGGSDEEATASADLKNAKVGEYVSFGNYFMEEIEEDDDSSVAEKDLKKPIEWLVLDKKDGKILVISRYAIDCQLYNSSYTDVCWEDSTLRTWLNGSFLKTAFNKTQQNKIVSTTVKTAANAEYGTESGGDVEDKIFILSAEEVAKYLPDNRLCKPTDYAKALGAGGEKGGDSCGWWLRNSGYNNGRAMDVDKDGSIDSYGNYVVYSYNGVRPAMWIKV